MGKGDVHEREASRSQVECESTIFDSNAGGGPPAQQNESASQQAHVPEAVKTVISECIEQSDREYYSDKQKAQRFFRALAEYVHASRRMSQIRRQEDEEDETKPCSSR